MTHDLVSDMIVRLKNASLRRHNVVLVPRTKTNFSILKVLKKEGYIQSAFAYNTNKILVNLKYKGWWIQKPMFSILSRISKPGQRVFSGYKNFSKFCQPLKDGQGIAIVSTSSGIVSHLKAKKLKKGGELFCYIS